MKKNVIGICLGALLFGVGVLIGLQTHMDITTRVRQTMVDCDTLAKGPFVQCVRKSFSHIIRPETLSQVMAAVELVSKERVGGAGLASLTCHTIAHVVGDLAANTEAPIAQLVMACGVGCEYGCVHGLFAGRFRQNPTIMLHPAEACTPQGYKGKANIKACWHGLGHAFAEVGAMMPDASLSYCDRVGGIYEQQECASGVFMEIFDPPLYNHPAQPYAYDVSNFCAKMPANYRNFCLTDGAVTTYSHTQNIAEAMAICSSLPVDLAHVCAISVGAAVYDRARGRDADVIAACGYAGLSTYAGKLNTGCLEGAVVSALGADPTGVRAQDICQRVPAWDCKGFVQTVRSDL